DQSIARLTTIRCSQGPNGRRRSKRSSVRTAARKDSCAMSSAAAASCTTRYAARYARGQWCRKRASRSATDPACAPRIQARSSRPEPAIARRLYGSKASRGPCTSLRSRGTRGSGGTEDGELIRDLQPAFAKAIERARATAAATGSAPFSGRLDHVAPHEHALEVRRGNCVTE